MPLDPMVVHREIVVEQSPAHLFDAWADPSKIAHWYVERAEGDARHDRLITWTIGGTDQLLEVTRVETDRQLTLTNVSDGPWNGTVLDVAFEPEGAPGSTRLILEQMTPAESLQDFMPNVDSGWACTLAVFGEYLQHHVGSRRTQVEAHTKREVDLAALAEAIGSADAIGLWAGERPTRVLVSAPRGAVVSFAAFAGVFTVMGVGGAHVFYNGWDDFNLEGLKRKVADLTNRLTARITP